MLQSEVRRLSAANDEIPELQKRVGSLDEEKETHAATVSHLEVWIPTYIYIHIPHKCLFVCLLTYTQATIKEERESHENEIQRLTAEHQTEKEVHIVYDRNTVCINTYFMAESKVVIQLS